MIYNIARNFYRKESLPQAPTERNIFLGSSGFLPGIQYYLDQDKLSEAESESKTYLAALRKRVQSLKSLRKQLQQIHK
jgi:hypothetical protein